jgi:hypothetical protein
MRRAHIVNKLNVFINLSLNKFGTITLFSLSSCVVQLLSLMEPLSKYTAADVFDVAKFITKGLKIAK